jgi:hypothetical protein
VEACRWLLAYPTLLILQRVQLLHLNIMATPIQKNKRFLILLDKGMWQQYNKKDFVLLVNP